MTGEELRRHLTTNPEHDVWDGEVWQGKPDEELAEWHATDHALHRRGHSHHLNEAVNQDGTGR